MPPARRLAPNEVCVLPSCILCLPTVKTGNGAMCFFDMDLLQLPFNFRDKRIPFLLLSLFGKSQLPIVGWLWITHHIQSRPRHGNSHPVLRDCQPHHMWGTETPTQMPSRESGVQKPGRRCRSPNACLCANPSPQLTTWGALPRQYAKPCAVRKYLPEVQHPFPTVFCVKVADSNVI